MFIKFIQKILIKTFQSSRYFREHMLRHQAVFICNSTNGVGIPFNLKLENLALYLINDECGIIIYNKLLIISFSPYREIVIYVGGVGVIIVPNYLIYMFFTYLLKGTVDSKHSFIGNKRINCHYLHQDVYEIQQKKQKVVHRFIYSNATREDEHNDAIQRLTINGKFLIIYIIFVLFSGKIVGRGGDSGGF